MKTPAISIFYRAASPVRVAAGPQLADAIDPARVDLEMVHLGEARARIPEAESVGVKPMSALGTGGQPFHSNFGAVIADLN